MSNVIPLNNLTRINLPVERVLEAAKNGMTEVVLIGYDKDGCHYFASSIADGGEVLWLIEKCKMALMGVKETEG